MLLHAPCGLEYFLKDTKEMVIATQFMQGCGFGVLVLESGENLLQPSFPPSMLMIDIYLSSLH